MCYRYSEYINPEVLQEIAANSPLVFTRDNFLKLALIYLRLSSSQSVFIMGETGVGKTAIIRYLADVLMYRTEILNVHAGVTEEQIISFVKEA